MPKSPVGRKPWGVLAYTVADDKSGGDSLDASARNELRAICDAADFGQMSVAAQVDFKRPKGVFRGSLTEAPRKSRGFEDVRAEDHPLWRRILGGVDEARSTLHVQKEQHDLSAARANVLTDFLGFGQKECPAERYVVFFYGHAYGPMGLFCDAESGQRDPDTLRLNDLAGSLQTTAGRAAVVVFRDCFMNTLETAYQLRDAADFMIATQSLAPIAGVWPWNGLMSALAPSADSVDIGLALAKQLGHFLDDFKNRDPFADVPISLLDLGAADAIVAPLTDLTDALEATRQDSERARRCGRALEAARVGSPANHSNPGDPALLDVPTMCDRLEALTGDPVVAPARALGHAVRSRLVRWHHAQKKNFHGTSVFYKPVTPRDLKRSYLQAEDAATAAADAAHYRTLALCEATGWHRLALNPLPI
ncbi:MAG TPA: clostripain-related cysteine peptidase [Vicinamibacterales bacterium]|nr:clostripain-related cysteine peptidase [Vicinamibacterales bacterium]